MRNGGQLAAAVAYIGSQRAAGRVVSPVTLDIGGNDMVGVFLGTGGKTITDTLPIFRANLQAILDALTGALTTNGQRTGDLILMNYYNPYPGQTIYDTPFTNLPDGQQPIVTDAEVPKFNQVIAEEAAARGIPLVDAYSAFAGREPDLIYVRFPILLFPFDANNFDYHPRPDGHALLARSFAEASGYVLPRAYLPSITR
jgi:lysophospholipase L1-like esterase